MHTKYITRIIYIYLTWVPLERHAIFVEKEWKFIIWLVSFLTQTFHYMSCVVPNSSLIHMTDHDISLDFIQPLSPSFKGHLWFHVDWRDKVLTPKGFIQGYQSLCSIYLLLCSSVLFPQCKLWTHQCFGLPALHHYIYTLISPWSLLLGPLLLRLPCCFTWNSLCSVVSQLDWTLWEVLSAPQDPSKMSAPNEVCLKALENQAHLGPNYGFDLEIVL